MPLGSSGTYILMCEFYNNPKSKVSQCLSYLALPYPEHFGMLGVNIVEREVQSKGYSPEQSPRLNSRSKILTIVVSEL